MPNRDEIKGKVDQATGKVRQGTGEATGNKRLHDERMKDEVPGEVGERDETIEALLHPDRSHHNEVGMTEDTKARQPADKSSPREQGAAPIDLTNVE